MVRARSAQGDQVGERHHRHLSRSALARVGALYQAKQALFVHAVASPYRDRSHFDGQNVLETGGNSAYAIKDGWLNRLLSLLPAEDKAIALAATIPMALRGLWGSFFGRKPGASRFNPFRLGLFPRIELEVAGPMAPAEATPDALQRRVLELRGDRK